MTKMVKRRWEKSGVKKSKKWREKGKARSASRRR